MSTNEELVLRAEKAAQQTTKDKAEIQELVTKLEEVQAPAIADAKEAIRQAINDKGVVVNTDDPFSSYAAKIQLINQGGSGGSGGDVGYPELKAEDVRCGVSFTDGNTSKIGTFTADATAVSSEILIGKTAYVKGQKVTGRIRKVTATRSENVVTVPSGYVANSQTLTVPEAATPTIADNVVTVYKGYQSEQKQITVGTAKEAETFTPGTSDTTIPADTYLSGEQVIKGDANLTSDNIKSGVSIFGLEGAFTSDADAEAEHILSGKTAYVKGEKITGTASGGAVIPFWYCDNRELRTIMGVGDSFGVPSRMQGVDFKTFDGKLVWFRSGYIPQQADNTINWTYVCSRDYLTAFAIGDGKIYRIGVDPISATQLFTSISGVTQLTMLSWGLLFCTSEGELYAANEGGTCVRVEYRRENAEDPIEYVNVSKILNCPQDSGDFWVITADGSLANGTIDTESFDYGYGGAAYVTIDPESAANGNPFVNYYPQSGDDYGGEGSAICELAFRADGLWYRQAKAEYTGGKYVYKEWHKADDPGLRKYDWLGYCSMYIDENWETGETTLKTDRVTLHVDEQGRLWKVAPTGQMSGYEITITGLEFTQVGEDTDWQYAPPSISRGQSGPGKLIADSIGQKGGKLLNMWGTNTDVVEVGWEEYPVSPPGRMVGCDRNFVYFAPEGASVDMSKAGGTF